MFWSKWLLVAYRSRREVGTPAPVTSPLLHALACSLCHYSLYNGHPQYYSCTYVLDAIGSLLQLLVCSQCHDISMINVIYWEPFLSPTTFPWMVIYYIYTSYTTSRSTHPLNRSISIHFQRRVLLSHFQFSSTKRFFSWKLPPKCIEFLWAGCLCKSNSERSWRDLVLNLILNLWCLVLLELLTKLVVPKEMEF